MSSARDRLPRDGVTHAALTDWQPVARACDGCLARAWLIDRLAGHLDTVRARIDEPLGLSDEQLILGIAGGDAGVVRDELARFDPAVARDRALPVGVESICRCDPAYPARVRGLEVPPAVLHVLGGLDRFLAAAAGDAVAIVGARRASQYGIDVASALGRDLARAGIPVVSGMALGIDSAAHAGAITAGGTTIAVLPAGAQRAYPPARRSLHSQIAATGAAVSELPGLARVRRWMFPARNRIIAALAVLTVVVEAREHSGALVTARFADGLGRPVGAVPGRVTSSQSQGTNDLLGRGAIVVRDAQDVLDLLYGAGSRPLPAPVRPRLDRELETLLEAIASGYDTASALEQAGFPAEQGLAALASLELAGYVRRQPGGRYAVTT
jgi:DNA processing protein